MSVAMATHKICPSASRWTRQAMGLLQSPRTFRAPSRHLVAVASSSSPSFAPSFPVICSSSSYFPLSTPHQKRLYSLDRPSSSPLSFFPSSNYSSSSDASPYGQSLEVTQWPITKLNTILNIVPQGKRMVVERFGKLHAIHESGFFFAIPIVDRIAYVIDVRERAVDILPQSAITRDNVSVEVSGNLFVRVMDPERAAYGARNPLYAVMMVSAFPEPTFPLLFLPRSSFDRFPPYSSTSTPNPP